MTTIHGVCPIPTTQDHVYAFEINAQLDATGLAELVETLNHAFDRHEGKINLLLRIDSLDAFQALKTMTVSALRMKLRSLRHIDRYAVVGGPAATSALMGVFGRLVPIDARSFAAEAEDAAWDFVNAPQNRA